MARRSASTPLLRRPLAELLRDLPPRTLAAVGLGPCMGCAMAPFETVEEAACILGRQPSRLAARLSAALRKGKR